MGGRSSKADGMALLLHDDGRLNAPELAQRLRQNKLIIPSLKMGGSSSYFDKTEWDKACGKLVSSEATIDGAPPTETFGIYFLTKLGVSQREYEVTDSASNLLYKTRAIEGTLSWFDVLGGADDCQLLRVQVDLSRRYWVIYRYGIPTFTGQMWDEAATEHLHTGLRRPLFRRACITVSWARYHAVVDMYEPGSLHKTNDGECTNVENDENVSSVQIEEKKSEGEVCGEKSTCCIHGESRTESLPVDQVAEETSGVATRDRMKPTGRETGEKNDASRENANVRIQFNVEESNDEPTSASEVRGHRPQLNPLQSFVSGELSRVLTCEENGRPQPGPSTLGESIKWVHSKALESVAAPYRPANKEEGLITLNKPVLKVQEINSIVGQHQTMLIQKEEARELKREEILMEAKLAKENLESPGSMAREDDCPSDDDELLNYLWHEYSNHTSESEDDEEKSDDAEAEGSIDVDENGTTESNMPNVSSDSCLIIASSEVETEAIINRSTSVDEDIDEQPLIGYWTWQNSVRVHRMKMHLARGSDLALHVVLAVVTNQLRYERHATVAVAI